MHSMFSDAHRDRRDVNHLMDQWLWILSLQQGAAAAAGLRMVLHNLIHPLDRQQLRPRPGMARLASSLATTALSTHSSGLKPWLSLKGGHRCPEALRLGRIAA